MKRYNILYLTLDIGQNLYESKNNYNIPTYLTLFATIFLFHADYQKKGINM